MILYRIKLKKNKKTNQKGKSALIYPATYLSNLYMYNTQAFGIYEAFMMNYCYIQYITNYTRHNKCK